jgi:hypothetical protein
MYKLVAVRLDMQERNCIFLRGSWHGFRGRKSSTFKKNLSEETYPTTSGIYGTNNLIIPKYFTEVR